MALVWVLLGILVLGGVAVVAAGRGEGLPPAQPDRPDLALPPDRPLVRSDVDQVRFSVGLRGYRMDEVDDVLDRLAVDLEARDERIAVLEREVDARRPVPVAAAAAPDEPAGQLVEAPADEPASEPADETAEQPEPEAEAEHEAAAATPGPVQAAGPVQVAGTESGEPEYEDEDEDLPVGRTMIVPFQQTDRRFARPDAPDDEPGGTAGA